MKKILSVSIASLLVSIFCFALTGYCQNESKLEKLTAEVISVTEHKGAPYTIEIKMNTPAGEKLDSITIDSKCTFYKDDERPKNRDIVAPGDKIEATYMVYEGTKVAFSILVLPK